MKPRHARFAAFAVLSSAPLLGAQTLGRPEPAITRAISEASVVTLAHNTRPEAIPANDRGRVADNFALDHMVLQLKRSAERESALQNFIAQLHDPTSPNFHRWVSPEQFGEAFGVARTDVDTVSAWLTSHGFTVNGAQASGMMIDFSGTAGMIRNAFHTEIHNLEVNGVAHFANISDPQIPEALAPVIAGVVSMHNFHPRPLLVPRGNYTYTNPNGTFHALVPGDIAKIYNIAPLFAQGLSGQGQTIMVVEDTYLYSTADWVVFRNTLGLSSYKAGSLTQVSPQGQISCKNPGFQGKQSDPGFGDDGEAAIDVEWASAAAPSAAIVLAACTDTNTTFGGLIALENVLNGPSKNLPSVVSISYGESEAANGAAANAAYFLAYQQAVAEGVSIFVSAGDEGAASTDNGNVATHGIAVSGFTSTPYNVSVGGTDFGYTPDNVPASTYWSANNAADYSSALSYIQEIPWNDSCAGGLVAGFLGVGPIDLCNNPLVTSSSGPLNFLLNAVGGSGGPSGCAYGTASTPDVVSGSCAGYAKPAYQKGLLGNPSDGVRDIPDVSLFASNGFWDAYYVTCWSNPNQDAGGGFSCTGAPSTWAGFGGTSVSSPIMAAIQALVNQKTKQRWGNPNTVYYALADAEFNFGFGTSLCNSNTVNKIANPCVFYDVTQGDNDVTCQALTTKTSSTLHNCFVPPTRTYGVLSTSPGSDRPAYTTNAGWDFATGIGSVNAFNLVMSWPASGEF